MSIEQYFIVEETKYLHTSNDEAIIVKFSRKGDIKMNNTALQAIFIEYGDAVCYLIADNNRKISIAYNSKTSVQMGDIELVTYGDIDFVKIKRTHSKDNEEYVFYSLIPTETIQNIIVMGDGFEDYRVDPYIIV